MVKRGFDGPATEFRKIVEGDFCSGCGACSVLTEGRIPMQFQPDGRYLPSVEGATEADLELAGQVCPFSSHGPDEDQIAESLFEGLPLHPAIGRHGGCFVGHVAEPGYRDRGSSGGLTSWVAAQLLERGEVDGILHVRPNPRTSETQGTDEPLFRFAIAETVEQLALGAKSHYYPIELSEVLHEVRKHPGKRFAAIGLPCFLKALHRLSLLDSALAQALGPKIGLVCGHLKTAAFAEVLAWQAGIMPPELATIDFRHKLPDRPASRYAMAAHGTDGRAVIRPMEDLDGRDWGQGWFRLNACSFCDDVVAETADISVGDAWLPGWIEDSRGTNVAVTRSARMQALIADGMASGDLEFSPLTADEVARSQGGGLRYRRDALELRLADARDAARWVPAKRVKPARRIRGRRALVLALREQMARLSREEGATARAAGDFGPLLANMAALVHKERELHRPTLLDRLKRRVRRLIQRPGQTA
jgi:coenzyme F420 hydrogenase subunit beta